MTKTYFTAFVTFRVRNEAGDLEQHEITQDVTDEVNEGADKENLADRLYWKHLDGLAGFFDIVAGGVRAGSLKYQ